MVQQNTYVKRSAQAKNNAAIAALAMVIAKENNDILYARSNNFKKKFLNFKAQVVKKYFPQAKARYFKNKASR